MDHHENHVSSVPSGVADRTDWPGTAIQCCSVKGGRRAGATGVITTASRGRRKPAGTRSDTSAGCWRRRQWDGRRNIVAFLLETCGTASAALFATTIARRFVLLYSELEFSGVLSFPTRDSSPIGPGAKAMNPRRSAHASRCTTRHNDAIQSDDTIARGPERGNDACRTSVPPIGICPGASRLLLHDDARAGLGLREFF